MDEFKSLKVVCIVVNAYGHFIPIMNCAKALKEKGHDVTILTNGDEGFKKKAEPMAEAAGVKMAYTDCGLNVDRDGMRKPEFRGEVPLDVFMEKWDPFVYTKL
jgi:UDP:flavonoid glycosyltransferase YjiC (YdhE family)